MRGGGLRERVLRAHGGGGRGVARAVRRAVSVWVRVCGAEASGRWERCGGAEELRLRRAAGREMSGGALAGRGAGEVRTGEIRSHVVTGDGGGEASRVERRPEAGGGRREEGEFHWGRRAFARRPIRAREGGGTQPMVFRWLLPRFAAL